MRPLSRLLRATLTCCALAVAGQAYAQQLDKAGYEQARSRAHADYKMDLERCREYRDNMRDVCRAEAKGKRQVALAEAAAAYRNTDQARTALREARIEADYQIARQKCGELRGQRRSACVMEAQAAETQSKAGRKNAG
jgi:hypothetical protein